MTMLTSLRDKIRKLRRSERTLILIRAHVRSGDLDIPVDIIDISETGSRLYAAKGLPLEEPLILSWGDQRHRGRIVRQDDNRYGVQFDVPIPRTVIEEMLVKAHKLAG